MGAWILIISGVALILGAVLLFVIGQLVLRRRQKAILSNYRDDND